jgi:hypothetical protein
MSDRNPDITAALGLLLAVWHGLTDAQRSALRRATPTTGTRQLQFDTHARTVRALLEHGYTGGDAGLKPGPRTLTPLGVILRAVGMADDAAQARRRYSKRKNPAEKARPA